MNSQEVWPKQEWMNYTEVKLKELQERWDEVSYPHRLNYLASTRFPFSFIEKKWPGMTRREKWHCLECQDIPLSFVSKLWQTFGDREKATCFRRYKLPMSFIRSHWNNEPGQVKIECIKSQKLTKAFIDAHWDDMPDFEQCICFCHQKYPMDRIMEYFSKLSLEGREVWLMQGFVENLPTSHLPALLTDQDERFRQKAKERMEAARYGEVTDEKETGGALQEIR